MVALVRRMRSVERETYPLLDACGLAAMKPAGVRALSTAKPWIGIAAMPYRYGVIGEFRGVRAAGDVGYLSHG